MPVNETTEHELEYLPLPEGMTFTDGTPIVGAARALSLEWFREALPGKELHPIAFRLFDPETGEKGNLLFVIISNDLNEGMEDYRTLLHTATKIPGYPHPPLLDLPVIEAWALKPER